MNALVYLSFLNQYTGSIWRTLMLMRCCYWYSKTGKPFYKFINPCNHPLYKVEDSWREELGCSRHQLSTVLKCAATKIKRGEDYNLLESGWVLYYAAGNGMTFFIPNYPKLLTVDFPKGILEKYFSHFAKWKNRNPNSEKWNSKIRISDLQRSNFGFSYIPVETQLDTHLNTQIEEVFISKNNFEDISPFKKEKSSEEKENVIMPFSSSDFLQSWNVWKQYRKETHDFQYTIISEQAALKSLANYSEEFSIQLLVDAMSSGWRSFHFADTPNNFLIFKNSKNGQFIDPSTGKQTEPHLAELYREYGK